MAGLSFDEGVAPDPQAPLSGWFDDWVAALTARRSAKTAAGYVSDAAKFGVALARVVGTPVPAEATDRAATASATAQPWVAALAAKGVGAASAVRARSVCDVLVLADLAPRNLGAVMDQLSGADATVRRVASAWSSLCGFLVRREVLASNPMDSPAVQRPRAPAAAPAPLSYPELERLFATVAQPDPRARDPWPDRDVAAAATLVSTGIRSSEAIGAKVGDLEALDVAPRLRVFGKGAKTRVIPVHDETARRLAAYLDARRDRVGSFDDDDPLLIRGDGSPFSSSALRRLVERWYVRAGVRRHPGAAVHALRHTWATTALDAGASVVEVQTILGHASLETTRRYLEVVGAGLDATMQAHPTRHILRASGR